MSSIAQKIAEYHQKLPQGVRLVAVSKFQPIEAIEEARKAGQIIFGESRLQELQEKVKHFPKDLEWHFIGHVQSKKVKTLLPLVSLIHAVDTEKLYDQIAKDAENLGIKVRILLQVHIAQEETKFGFSPDEIVRFMEEPAHRNHPHVCICGLMGMATFTDDKEQVRKEFRTLKQLFDLIKSKHFEANADFCELSMGMSNDYAIALEEGATLVRIGTDIFGSRY